MSQGLRHPDPSRPPSNNHMTPRPSSQPHPQNGSLSNLSHPSPGNNNTSSTPNNCNNNLSNGIPNNGMNSSLPTDCHSLGDLNFDPTAIINGDISAAQGLDVSNLQRALHTLNKFNKTYTEVRTHSFYFSCKS